MISFIKIKTNDLATIESLARKTWPDTFGLVMSKEQIEYMLDLNYSASSLERQMALHQHFVIIKYNDEAVGYTSYELNYQAEPQLMIHKVYLLPSAQGLGLGRQTFDYLTDLAVQHEQQALTLKVFHKNERAISFYLKKGFENIGSESTDIGGGFVIHDFIMRKELR